MEPLPASDDYGVRLHSGPPEESGRHAVDVHAYAHLLLLPSEKRLQELRILGVRVQLGEPLPRRGERGGVLEDKIIAGVGDGCQGGRGVNLVIKAPVGVSLGELVEGAAGEEVLQDLISLLAQRRLRVGESRSPWPDD